MAMVRVGPVGDPHPVSGRIEAGVTPKQKEHPWQKTHCIWMNPAPIIYSSYSIYSEIIPSIQQVYVEVGKQDQ